MKMSFAKKRCRCVDKYLGEKYNGTIGEEEDDLMEERKEITWAETFPKGEMPSIEDIAKYIESPLFRRLCNFLETEFSCKSKIEFSCCSMQPGWNMKYRKSGRPVCTIYPEKGHFFCMISTNQKMQPDADLFLTGCGKYLQKLSENTPALNGGKWLMIDVTDEEILRETMELAAIRIKKNK